MRTGHRTQTKPDGLLLFFGDFKGSRSRKVRVEQSGGSVERRGPLLLPEVLRDISQRMSIVIRGQQDDDQSLQWRATGIRPPSTHVIACPTFAVHIVSRS